MGGFQAGAGKTNVSEPLLRRRNAWMASELVKAPWDKSGGVSVVLA